MANNDSSSGDATSVQLGHLAETVTSGGPQSSAGPSTNPIIHPEARVIWDKAAREQYLLKVLKANGQILPLGNRPFTELKMVINGFIHLQGKQIPVFVPRSEYYLELHFAVQEILEVQIDQAVELHNGLRNQLVQARKLYYEKDDIPSALASSLAPSGAPPPPPPMKAVFASNSAPNLRKRTQWCSSQEAGRRAIPRDEQERTSKIFVGDVSQDATESDFKEYFMQYDRVVDATLMMDKDIGREERDTSNLGYRMSSPTRVYCTYCAYDSSVYGRSYGSGMNSAVSSTQTDPSTSLYSRTTHALPPRFPAKFGRLTAASTAPTIRGSGGGQNVSWSGEFSVLEDQVGRKVSKAPSGMKWHGEQVHLPSTSGTTSDESNADLPGPVVDPELESDKEEDNADLESEQAPIISATCLLQKDTWRTAVTNDYHPTGGKTLGILAIILISHVAVNMFSIKKLRYMIYTSIVLNNLGVGSLAIAVLCKAKTLQSGAFVFRKFVDGTGPEGQGWNLCEETKRAVREAPLSPGGYLQFHPNLMRNEMMGQYPDCGKDTATASRTCRSSYCEPLLALS
ncbi:MAG: hypothetical protein LQ352_007051 [Teloschistes flavicans]|nr:MAG: hypothetical protein LQ352_007051 [Teloschistes flavicans]